MDKQRKAEQVENSSLIKRVKELSQKAYQGNFLTHTQFLTASEQSEFLEAAGKNAVDPQDESKSSGMFQSVPWVLYGGTEDAERRVLCFLPDYLDKETFLIQEETEPETVVCIEVSPVNRKFAEELTHRDYLGALMNLGIERDRVGDILTDSETAFLFVMKENADLIESELVRIRHTSVKCRKVPASSCTIRPEFEEREGSVSSERLDAVLAMVYHLSRGKAQELVEQEMVLVDGRLAYSGGYDLKPGSRVSVRGHGKFQYLGVGAQTKKGRFYAKVKIWK